MKILKNMLLISLCALFSTSLFAETLVLKSGDQLVGDIISETQEKVIINVNNVPLELRSEDILFIVENGVRRNVGEEPVSAQSQIPSSTDIIPVTQPVSPGGINEATSPPETIPSDDNVESATLMPLLPVILPQGGVYQVTGAGIRFREGPSLDYPVVTTLPGQSILIEIEFSDDWMRAKTLEGVEGWIHRNFIHQMDNVPCLCTGSNVNVRESPGEVFRSFDRLVRGEVVMKLSERGDWFYVLTSDEIAGWTVKDYLQPLTDTTTYKPSMMVVINSEVGMPILMEKSTGQMGKARVTFTVRDESIIKSGKTKLLIFHKDRRFLEQTNPLYASETILQQQRLATPTAILNVGLPEELGMKFVGADILTMLGKRVSEGWQYSLTVPDSPNLIFAFMVQKGSSRGTVILTQ